MVRIIGDIHGDFEVYQELIKDIPYSIQVGDFGFKDAWTRLDSIDHQRHKILPGNHDNYDYIKEKQPLHVLQDYGISILDGFDFFFVRGADSIDKKWRIEGRSWWKDEELTYHEFQKCIDLYKDIKPDIVITHTCPESIIYEMFKFSTSYPSITGNGLNRMFEIHQPKLWIFSHMHPDTNIIKKINNTLFICLKIQGFIDYNTNLTLERNLETYQITC